MNCLYCQEPIVPGDMVQKFGNDVFHHECAFRTVAGSVGHIRKRCSCCGGQESDPPGLTLRQAAKAALELFQQLQN